MDLETLKEIVEKVKDECLVKIEKTDPMMSLVYINNEGVNHGVMQMYYKILTELYRLDTELIKKEAAI